MAWMVLVAVVALPVVEITLFIKSAQWLGLLPTILAAFAAGIIGIALIRAQGFQLLLRTRAQLDRGEVPVREVF
ncbi:MAG TPA: FxsA family protein, partial [Magnetospirillum sp.]|nr:FxsA family protein [Magnetospirillum sp.]